jgi:plastocyanin
MHLTVQVVPDEEPTQTQAELDAAAEEQRAVDLSAARDALEAGENADLPAGTVMAGSEEGAAVVTAFFPQEISVPRGSTVTWVNEGNDPHVVSFEGDIGPHDPENFAPPSVPPGSRYEGGPAISGVFGMTFPARSFALRFTEPGEYQYVCPIHPGMGGTVRVESG